MKKFGVLFFSLYLFTSDAFSAENNLLFEAIKKKDKVEIEDLLSKGIDVNTKNASGWSPLLETAMLGSIDIAELLLAKGADINVVDKGGS